MVNNYLYNRASEYDNTSGWYDTFFRSYDPVLGRFGRVDPKADKFGAWSPYNYAYDSPTRFNDPLGDEGYSEVAAERIHKLVSQGYAVFFDMGDIGQWGILQLGMEVSQRGGAWAKAEAAWARFESQYQTQTILSQLSSTMSRDGVTLMEALIAHVNVAAATGGTIVFDPKNGGVVIVVHQEIFDHAKNLLQGVGQTQETGLGFQDNGTLTVEQLQKYFEENYRKLFHDPLMNAIKSGTYSTQDVINYVQNFNYADIASKKGPYTLVPVTGGRFQVTDPSGSTVMNTDLFLDRGDGIYFGYQRKIMSGELRGEGVIEFTTSSGYLVQFTLRFEGRLFH